MNFTASFCDPFNPAIIELGGIQKERILDKFEKVNWSDYLQRMQSANSQDIYYSPSISFENSDTTHGLAISAVGVPDNYEFYIFYKRPKIVKKFLGLKKKNDENYVSDKTGQTKNDVIDCLNAFIRNDMEYLISKIGP